MLAQIRVEVVDDLSDTLIQGAFVMAVATVEGALADTLTYYLIHFPEKLPEEQQTAVSTLPTNVLQFLERAAERFVTDLSYKPIREFFVRFVKILSIETDSALAAAIEVIQEAKATRNLLLHNRGVVNDFYLVQAGSKRRAAEAGVTLRVDQSYVCESTDALSAFIGGLAAALVTKYSSYTKVAAHRKLWQYIFNSPIMPYDEFWSVDEAADKIVASRIGARESSISTSEQLFLGVWRAHFNGGGEYLTRLHMRRFDPSNLRKFHFLLSIARTFPWS